MKLFCLTVLATVVCVGTAFAQPVYLTCKNGAHLVFDEATGQAGYQNDKLYAAKFSETQIMWDSQEQRGYNGTWLLTHNELDRRSGVFSVDNEKWDAVGTPTTCVVGTMEPATKF